MNDENKIRAWVNQIMDFEYIENPNPRRCCTTPEIKKVAIIVLNSKFKKWDKIFQDIANTEERRFRINSYNGQYRTEVYDKAKNKYYILHNENHIGIPNNVRNHRYDVIFIPKEEAEIISQRTDRYTIRYQCNDNFSWSIAEGLSWLETLAIKTIELE